MTGGMFDPLPNGSVAGSVSKTEPEWRVILPVPERAPAPPAKHPALGAPAMRWEYRDAGGRMLGAVCRFQVKGGGKEIRSLVFAEHRKHGRQWRWLGFPKPGRPLYALDRLAARPDAPVCVTEGEKAADAAGKLLPGHVAVTSPGGSKAARAADWSALAGRKVTVWRDADKPGEAYAADVAALLCKLSPAPAVAIVTPPEGVAEGWDAADALAEGWTPQRAAELIAAAVPAGGGGAAPRKPAARDWLLDLIAAAELWHDPERNAYATVPVDDHRENFALASDDFKSWLAWRAFDALGVSPASEAIEGAIRVAKGVALNRGHCYRTFRRVAEDDGCIYLDLGGADWRAVKVAPIGGFEIVDTVPVKFLRSRGMEALPEPEDGELIENLREFVNVETEADFRLIVAWLVAALRAAGPFPILAITGQQGSSKSTLARIARLLIDPNASPIRATPRDDRDLIVSAANSWALVYDNISSIPTWLSDALCRLSTGGGYATRKLHSDSEETIFAAQRPIVMNGIGDVATRGDLADRVLSITLPPIPEDRRRDEGEFWGAFNAARPRILGALLNAVAAGLRNRAAVRLDRKPRMADFALWIEACSPGLGWEPGGFVRDYEENRSDAMAAAAEASPFVPVIEAILGRGGLPATGFAGTASELLAKLRSVCSESDQRARWFPATASHVGAALRRVAPLLRQRNIEFQHYRRGANGTRQIELRCVSEAVFEELRSRVAPKGAGGGGE